MAQGPRSAAEDLKSPIAVDVGEHDGEPVGEGSRLHGSPVMPAPAVWPPGLSTTAPPRRASVSRTRVDIDPKSAGERTTAAQDHRGKTPG